MAYFSELMRQSGIAFGGAEREPAPLPSSSAPELDAPVGFEALEVEEVREAPAFEAGAQEPEGRPSAPEAPRRSEGFRETHLPPQEPPRLSREAPPPPQARPEAPWPSQESAPPVLEVTEEVIQSGPRRDEVSQPATPRGQQGQAGEQRREGPRRETGAADTGQRQPGRGESREELVARYLAEVRRWVSATPAPGEVPPTQSTTSAPGPVELEEEVTEVVGPRQPAAQGATPPAAVPPRRQARPAEARSRAWASAIEGWDGAPELEEQAERRAGGLSTQSLTLSIGTINVTVEDPKPSAAPQPVPPRPASNERGTRGWDGGTRWWRHYLRV